jgi:hypothetical protein
MKIVTVNGVSYLGTLEQTEKGDLILKDAMALYGPSVTKGEIEHYYRKGNLGELETITFGGMGVSYSVSQLTDEAVMFCRMADLMMEQAKKVAVRKLENSEFSQSLGKM